MKFRLHFVRIATLPLASLLLIIAVAEFRQVCAVTSQAESETERYIVSKLQRGQLADLEDFPDDKRKLGII